MPQRLSRLSRPPRLTRPLLRMCGLLLALTAASSTAADAADTADTHQANNAGAVTAADRFNFDRAPGRLSKAVRPRLQQLQLDIDPASPQFEGRSTLTLQLRGAQDSLQLHAHQLQLIDAQWLGPAGPARPLQLQADETQQTWRLTPTDGRPLASGSGRLQLHWRGEVQNSGNGLYRAPYGPPDAPRHLLATQLQAIYARQVFPSFDEPAFRTAFELSVRVPAGWQVLSNMPTQAAPSAQADGRLLHRFARTPPMPSYLLALAVGQFDELPGRAAGVPLRILTVPGKQAQGAFALQATQQLLPHYTRYFGQAYALPRLDQLAVPSTRNGAMEDWGLISYAEDLLLIDPATASTANERVVFELVAHEVAHQWFGNLVTAASWEEIWLNEAFATWMAHKAGQHFHPQWQLALRARSDIDRTLERDGGPATRAIRSGAVDEDAVLDVFDNITYTKGGAVLAMLEDWLGEAPFRRGLQSYMRARRLSNATAGDLWFHIGRASAREVSRVASSWTDQPGFPLISVESRCERGQTRLTLSQQAYGPNGSRWQVPLTLQHGARRHTLLLQRDQQQLRLPGCPAVPTRINPSGIGYYRVLYADAQRQALARAFVTLPAATQVTLLSDQFALAQSARLPMADWLALVAQLPAVQGPGRAALWSQAIVGLHQLQQALAGSPAAAPLDAAARALLAPELQALGWQPRGGEGGESSETEALRNALISALARHGDAAVIAQAAALFDADEAGRAPLPPAIRAVVITAAGRSAGAARHAVLQRRLLAADSEEERWTYAEALAAATDPALLPTTLALALDTRLPANIAVQLPSLVGQYGLFREQAYLHVQQHWAELAQRAGDTFLREWLLPGPARDFNTEGAAQRLLDDQQRLRGQPGRATAERAAAHIRLLAALKEREEQALVAPLQALAALPPRR